MNTKGRDNRTWLFPVLAISLTWAVVLVVGGMTSVFSTSCEDLVLAYETAMVAALYALCRAYGLRKESAAVLALSISITPFMFYFQIGGRGPLFGALPLVFGAWALLRCLMATKTPSLMALPAAFLVFLTLSWGRAQEGAALLIIAAACAGEVFAKDRRRAGWIAASVLLGIAAYAPVAGDLAGWNGGLFNSGRLVPTLGQVLNLSNPVWMPHVLSGTGEFLPAAPIFFAAWFAQPLLFFIDWRRLEWKGTAGIAGLAGIFLFLAVGPERLGPLSFPLLWVPYVQAALLVLLFTLAEQGNLVVSRARLGWAFAAFAVTSYCAVMEYPEPALHAAPLLLLPAVFIAALPKFLRTASLPFFLAVTTAILAVATIWTFSGAELAIPHPSALLAHPAAWHPFAFLAPAIGFAIWAYFAAAEARSAGRHS